MRIMSLSLSQPYATLIALGAKKLETRSWSTGYRGPLAIHAAKGLHPSVNEREFWYLCNSKPFASALREDYGVSDPETGDAWINAKLLPRGAVLALCELTGCYPTRSGPGSIRYASLAQSVCLPPPEPERSFGDYSPSRWVWALENVKRLAEPFPARGRLGLWTVDIPEQMLERS